MAVIRPTSLILSGWIILVFWSTLVYGFCFILPLLKRTSRFRNVFWEINTSFAVFILALILWTYLRLHDGDLVLTRSPLSAGLQISLPASSLLAAIWLNAFRSFRVRRCAHAEKLFPDLTCPYPVAPWMYGLMGTYLAVNYVNLYPFTSWCGNCADFLWGEAMACLCSMIELLLLSLGTSFADALRIEENIQVSKRSAQEIVVITQRLAFAGTIICIGIFLWISYT